MNVKLDPEDEREVEALANDSGQDPEDILRDLVHDALLHRRASRRSGPGNAETFLDAALRLNVVGCVKGGPPDVASDSRHMEGFGDE